MNKELEKNRPEGWKKGIKPNNKKIYTADDLNFMYEAGADALIKAGYRLPPTADREAVIKILKKNITLHSVRQGYGVFNITSFEDLADQILALCPNDEGIKDLAVQAIADEPEFPSGMPDEMYEAIIGAVEDRGDRSVITDIMRNVVRITKRDITGRFLKAISQATIEGE